MSKFLEESVEQARQLLRSAGGDRDLLNAAVRIHAARIIAQHQVVELEIDEDLAALLGEGPDEID